MLAELGSLSIEFTRLAQITKEAKYYDAIARITNEFEMWQNNTRIPGLWPKKVDASGCKKEDLPLISPIEHSMQKGPGVTSKQKVEKMPDTAGFEDDGEAARNAGIEKYMIKTGTGNGLEGEENSNKEMTGKASKTTVEKRQLQDGSLMATSAPPKPDCKPQGLNSPPFTTVEDFVLGGQADSVYEYLPKEYLLLGGLEPQYQSMYEPAVEATKEYLLFRAMIPDEKRKILFTGTVSTSGKLDDKNDVKLKAEATHLDCFVGGMFAIGAKIFNRDDDLELAKQLTDACVWAYESTATGIMPEHFLTLPCDGREKCAWNETRYWEALDPYKASRPRTNERYQAVLDEKKAAIDQKPKMTTGQAGASIADVEQGKAPSVSKRSAMNNLDKSFEGASLAKRQLGNIENDVIQSSSAEEGDEEARSSIRSSLEDSDKAVADQKVSSTETNTEASTSATATSEAESESTPSATRSAALAATKPVIPQYTPPPIPTPEEYAKARIRDERLPPGVIRVTGPKYILRYADSFLCRTMMMRPNFPVTCRPEAIESVFIMWRITGDVYWRKKGWDMFEAIHKATSADFGASAILDVTSETPVKLDEMESFWLAETLKYFYLLFSDPSLISLDDYVLYVLLSSVYIGALADSTQKY